jgi:hypothetical protein
MKLRQKMMMNVTSVVVFSASYETRAKDNNECASSLFVVFFSYIAEDNDGLPHSSSSSTIQKKHKNPEEDDELSNSSLSSTTQEKKP